MSLLGSRCSTLLALLATLMLAGFALAQNPGDVLISESMYDDTASTDVEWVEVYNNTANAIDISSWFLQDAGQHPPTSEGGLILPASTTIAAGQYLVLSSAALPEIAGEVVCGTSGSFGLNNGGDNLSLWTAQSGGTMIDGSLTVLVPDSSTVGGNSTERCSFTIGYDIGSNWHMSTNVFATTGRYRRCTPGAANTPCGPGDTTPPTLVSATVISASAVDLLWNEAVGLASAQTVTNYVVNNGIGNPLTATRDGGNQAIVHLTFAPLANNTYTVTASNIADLVGNVQTTPQVASFTVNITVAPGAVVITEVMYDDTASGSNPDVEWVEIHNTTASAINMSLWRLTDYSVAPPTSEGDLVIPAGMSIPAGGYLVLCKVAMPEIPAAIVCVDSMSWGLGNSGDNLALYSADYAQLVDGSLSVNYPDLSIPGNSIEKCDVNAQWSGLAADWHESTNVFGTGRYLRCTPGAANTPCVGDVDPPTLVSATALSTTLVEVVFNEALDETSAELVTNYVVDLAVGSPNTATLQTNPTTVRLLFGTTLTPNTYTLTVNNVADVALNAILPNSQVQFTVTAPSENLKITEFMPNPAFTGTADSLGEWFEIYNAGASAVDLTGWILADNAGADTIESGTINPGGYFVFCSNGDSLTNGGVPADFDYRFATSGWGISLSNSGETIFLRNPLGIAVASVTYTTAFHWGAGVSAQLIDLNYSGAVDTMWCAGYQTWPGAWNGDLGTPGVATACQPVAPPDTLTVCQVREQDACGVASRLNTRVVTHGVVTWVDPCAPDMLIEYNGCAVQIFGTAVTTNMVGNTRPPMIGDTIEVWGYITQFRGITEFSTFASVAPVITYLGTAAVPAAVVVSAATISKTVDDCAGETYESRLVSVLNATFLNGGGTFSPGDTTYPALVGTDTVLYYVDSCDVSLLDATIPSGSVNLLGAVGQYDSTAACLCGGYQLVYAGGTAFVPAVCPDPVQLTVIRDDSLAVTATLRWAAGIGSTCNTYKIYASTDGSAVFPSTYILVDTVSGVTSYTDNSALAPRRFYHVTSDN